MATLNFKGKGIVLNHHLSVPFHELVPDQKKGLTAKPRLDDNLIIHGDNLLALKALLPTYAGRVKCIYIDPPYNTGNEGWAYNDNVNSPMMQDWLGKTVDTEDLTRHDKWLCMMTPRLKLLRELLADDGAIFISIDDNEIHRLRMLMDEIFDESNFLANIIWQKVFAPKNTAKDFSEDHEYVMVYARNKNNWKPFLVARTAEQDARYKNFDNDPRGIWTSDNLTARNPYDKGLYTVISRGGKKFRPPMGSYWRVSEENFKKLDKDNRIWWGKGGNNMPRLKRFLSDVKQGVVPQTLWLYGEVGHTQDAKKELVAIMDFKESDDVFVTVKPSTLIKKMIAISSGPNDIILDSFAGSGTTAHAVLALNQEDGGNRRFILVEMEDYADKITAERVRRVIKGVKGAKDENLKKGLGGTFSYFELGKAIDEEGLLSGKTLPSYEEMARYVFHTATGAAFDAKKINRNRNFIGENAEFEVYLLYEPDVASLKELALTLPFAEKLGQPKGKRRLVFAPTKYLSADDLAEHRVEFAQLPFDIYRRLE